MEKLIGTLLSILLFSSLLSILLFTTPGFASIIESNEGGSAFATDTSLKLCREPNVSAVLMCTGNVVKAVSSVKGEGFTIYKPEGRIIPCPEVDPKDMGADCTMYLMTPNICQAQSVCADDTSDIADEANVTANQSTTHKKNKTEVGAPDITVNMSLPELVEAPDEGPIGQEAFIFGVIIVGMIAVALINYVYFKSKGTN